MELVIFIVSRREQLVSRRDIVTKLWRSDLFIDTEPNINNIVRKIRTALGDNSTKPRFLDLGRKRVPIYRPSSGD
jgi:DNA-binding winged helix-turn-helix (wHTH) protein